MLLLVDDDCELRETLKEFLALQGYIVQGASNGSEALQLCRGSDTPPELILLDLMMPVLDGWGFLGERGKDPRLASIPVVMVSGSSGIERKAKEAGATAVITKPVEPHALLEMIGRFASVN
jgi:CheY-like chemotaxis protein